MSYEPPGRVYQRTRKEQRVFKVRPARRPDLSRLEVAADPVWREQAEWGRKRALERRRELLEVYGAVSCGVEDLLRLGFNAIADSDYLRSKAWDEADSKARVEMFKVAHSIGQIGKGHEQAASELCAKEAKALKAQAKSNPHGALDAILSAPAAKPRRKNVTLSARGASTPAESQGMDSDRESEAPPERGAGPGITERMASGSPPDDPPPGVDVPGGPTPSQERPTK